MNKWLKLTAFATALSMLTISMSGCKGKYSGTLTSLPDIAKLEKTTPDTYPIKSDVTIKYYLPLPGGLKGNAKAPSLNESEYAKELKKRTGINVDFVHPPSGLENERFNMMINSGDLPDIVEADWFSIQGGPIQAIDDGIILRLNEVFDKFSPNIKQIYGKVPDVAKQLMTDRGDYFLYPFIRESELLNTYMGWMIRKDLLDKAGLPIPETLDELEKTLYEFKKMGVKVPINIKMDNGNMSSFSPILGAYGAIGDFFLDGDKVKYGPNEPVYKDFIVRMNKWFTDGILDKDFSDTDGKRIDAIVVNGEVGCIYGGAGGEFGKWIPLLKKKIKDAEFVPIKYPVMVKGERPKIGQKNWAADKGGAAITSRCKNIEVAARLLDYGYSKDGFMLNNFGIEGVSYNWKDGVLPGESKIAEERKGLYYDWADKVPVYTDEIMSPEKRGKLSVAQSMARFIRAYSNGSSVQARPYIFQYYALPVQREALAVWSDTDTYKYKMPFVSFTPAENKRLSTLMTGINSLRSEWLYKMIMGIEPIERYNEYLNKLNARGIDEAMKIQQAAYDRFKNRK